jgi:peptidoglycan/LPS O-acetylase OafA/YrhL
MWTADFWRYTFYLQNLYKQANAVDYFPVAWSLSVEEWFYVTFPLLTVLLATQLDRRSNWPIWIAALMFITMIVAARTVVGIPENWDAEMRRVTIFRLDSIACGFCLYLLLTHGNFHYRWLNIAYLLLFLLSAAIGLTVTYLALFAYSYAAQIVYPFVAALFGVAGVGTAYAVRAYWPRSGVARAFGLHMGRMSYSVYLFHLLLILQLKPALNGLPVPLQMVAYIACLVVFSSVFYQYFERPILDARPAFRWS